MFVCTCFHPMYPTLLLTSFDIWEPHHTTNASDDLIDELIFRNLLPANTHLLRKIPVDFQKAPQLVIHTIQTLQPNVVICCGMAEKRSRLTLETRGHWQETHLHTSLDLPQIAQKLAFSEISHDAGKFVCNYLYFSILKYLQERSFPSHCLFIHVPLLHEGNLHLVLHDFVKVLHLVREQFSLPQSA